MSLSSPRKTAVIAGGGVAGLAAAVFLDELGFHVTLLEKKPKLGGRTYSFTDRVTGMSVDNGQHLLIGAYHDTWRYLRAVGASSRVHTQIPSIIPLANDSNKIANLSLADLPPPLPLLSAILRFKHFSWRDRLAVLRAGLAVKRLLRSDAMPPADMSVAEWLASCHQTQVAMRVLWEPLTLATLNDTPEKTTADGLVQVLQGSFFGSRRDPYLVFPRAPLSDVLVKPAEAYLQQRGHMIHSSRGVAEIRILDGRAKSILTSDGEVFKPDLCISALPFRDLLRVLPPAFIKSSPALFPVRNFTSSPIVSINLFYDRPVMHTPLLGACAGDVHWFFCRNLMDQSLQNSPHKIPMQHIVGVKSGAYDWQQLDKSEMIHRTRTQLENLLPAARQTRLQHALVNRENSATLASGPGINTARPAQKLLSNFYLVGDWTRTGLPATIESAVRSARMMSEEIANPSTD